MAQSQRLRQIQKQRLAPVQRLCGQLLEVPLSELDARIEEEQQVNPYLDQELEAEEKPVDFELTEREGQRSHKGEYVDNWFQDDGEQIYRVVKSEEGGERERSASTSLIDDLMQQLHLNNISEKKYEIGEMIIGNIDERGYLRRSPEAIADDWFLNKGEDLNIEEVEEVWKLVRTFEPAGVGAIDIKDCLMLQLERTEATDEVTLLAEKIITNHWDLLCKRQFDLIRKRLNIEPELFNQALKKIHKLNPAPGYVDSLPTDNMGIIPDFIVRQTADGEIEFSLNRPYRRHLKVNPEGERMLARLEQKPEKDDRTIQFLKDKIESAKTFIEAFNQREQTLKSIMGAIIDYQREYFLTGDKSKLRPMKYDTIRQMTGFGESTISRMANEKYVQTHFGTFKLKDVFSNSVNTSSGEEVSAEAIRSELAGIIENEDKTNPYTDEELAELLQKKNYAISRRTVAKYRDRLNIAPASRRRRR